MPARLSNSAGARQTLSGSTSNSRWKRRVTKPTLAAQEHRHERARGVGTSTFTVSLGRDVHPDVAVDKLIKACSVDPP